MAEAGRRITITIIPGGIRRNLELKGGGATLRFRDELEQFTGMLNLISARDTNRTGLQVFRWILENRQKMISSSRMGEACDMNRLTCLHHLRRLEELGILDNVDGRYVMTSQSMEKYINALEREAMGTFSALKKLARRIDEKYSEEEMEGGRIRKNVELRRGAHLRGSERVR